MIYREDDWVAEVKVLEDLSDDVKESYTLRVEKTIKESQIYYPTADGTVFTVDQLRGYRIWSLRHE